MVYCHVGLPSTNYFSLFHMAIFVMASGMLFNSSRLETKEGRKSFWKGKFLHLYLPFVLFNFVLLCFNNLFCQTGFYPTDIIPGVMENPAWIQGYIDGSKFFYKTIQIFFTMYFTQMGNGTWFLATLLWTETVFFLLSLLFANFEIFRKKPWLEIAIEMILAFQLLILVFFCTDKVMPRDIKRLIFFIYAFSLGRCFRLFNARYDFKIYIKLIIVVVSALGLFVLNQMGSVALWSVSITDPFFFTAACCLGWCLAFYGCSLLCYLPKYVTYVFSYVGSKTVWIVCFHFLAFKLVTFVYLRCNDLPSEYLGAYPVLPYNNSIWLGIIYLLVGLILPILLSLLYQLSKRGVVSLYSKYRQRQTSS